MQHWLKLKLFTHLILIMMDCLSKILKLLKCVVVVEIFLIKEKLVFTPKTSRSSVFLKNKLIFFYKLYISWDGESNNCWLATCKQEKLPISTVLMTQNQINRANFNQKNYCIILIKVFPYNKNVITWKVSSHR